MDLQFELETVHETITSYERITTSLGGLIQTAEALKNGVSPNVWSGESKEQFDVAFQAWINEANKVVADIARTQDAIVRFAANGGAEMKQQSERMISHF